jgi:hypothetical protein
MRVMKLSDTNLGTRCSETSTDVAPDTGIKSLNPDDEGDDLHLVRPSD